MLNITRMIKSYMQVKNKGEHIYTKIWELLDQYIDMLLLYEQEHHYIVHDTDYLKIQYHFFKEIVDGTITDQAAENYIKKVIKSY